MTRRKCGFLEFPYIPRDERMLLFDVRREPSPILIGVFSRGGYKIARNETQALNLTCFHGFRPNALGERRVDGLFLYLSSEVGRKIVSMSARMYGDSLTKFEPNDLNSALAPSPQALEDLPPERRVGCAGLHAAYGRGSRIY